MPFKPPARTPLTENQSKALSKLSAINTFLSAPDRPDKNIPKEKQISSFDYLSRMAINIFGAPLLDTLLLSFFDKLFSNSNDKLEKMALKAMAKSLESNQKTISPNMSNEDWLMRNVLPTFRLAKSAILAQIISMTFGPRRSMESAAKRTNTNLSTARVSRLLESAACAGSGKLFSLSNDDDTPNGDLEYNRVELRKQLEEGAISITISCQDVKIRLPEDSDRVLGITTQANPADIIVNLENYVNNEVQRQNTPENANAVSKSFMQEMVSKSTSLISEAVSIQMDSVIATINAANNSLNVTPEDTFSSSCEIVELCAQGNDAEFKRKSAFAATLMNIVYAFLITLMFREISKRIKGFIKKALLKKAKRRRQRLIERQRQRFSFIDDAGNAVSRANKVREALKSLDDVFDLVKDV